MASSRPEEGSEASTVALAPPMTGANAFPYMRGSKTCRLRLIGQSVLEAKRSFRRPKCREAPSWQCLPIPPVISQGFFWKSRSANVKIAAIRKLLRLQPITDGEERQQMIESGNRAEI